MAEVICYHLITGVEIVGTLTDETEEFFILEKVRKIHTTVENGELTIMLLPYASGNLDVEMDFFHESIVSDYEPDSDFIASYNRQIYGADIATSIGV